MVSRSRWETLEVSSRHRSTDLKTLHASSLDTESRSVSASYVSLCFLSSTRRPLALSLLLVTPQPLPLLTRLLRLSSVTYSSASSSLARFTSSSRGRTLVETEFTDHLLLLPCSARTTRPRSSSSSVSLRCQRGRSWPSETIIPLSDSSPRWGGLEFGLTGESTRFENESRRDGQSTSLTALLLLVPSSAHPVVDLKSPESE